MSFSLRRAGILVAVAAMLATFLATASRAEAAPTDSSVTYLVTVENLTDGQLLTPAVVATHDRTTRVFRPGHPASDGVQQLAENGGVPVLVDELAAAGVTAVGVAGGAPIAPSESAELLISGGPGAVRLSVAAMLICTNDGFAGLDRLALPKRYGDVRVGYGNAYDAGTEINTESYADLVPPCDDAGQTGETNPDLAEGGVVAPHAGIAGGADLDPATHGWTDPVIRVSVERVQVFDVTVENLTSGQLHTPYVLATHSPTISAFEIGSAASAGIQELAENGGVPVLAEELGMVAGVGTVAVVGSAPIPGGSSASAQVIARGGQPRVTLAAMLICTNDGFAGIDGARLPAGGDVAEFYGNAYDAGTEINTESYADLVPPCDDAGQTGETNPDLAEGGVVAPHAGITGGADLDPATHGWTDPVVKVTIERTG